VSRKYYSVRKSKNQLTTEALKLLFGTIFQKFADDQYFDEAFGFTCVDQGWIPGTMGKTPEIYFLRHLRKPNLWPVSTQLNSYTEEDLFDVIEILYDLVSEPLEGSYHSWNDCGMHYSTFNQPSGRTKFRFEINELLSDYKGSYELAENGEIVERADSGVGTLLSAKLPSTASHLNERLDEAIGLFRRRHSSLSDRHNAVRMLADILEELRPGLKAALARKDESDLFNIANNFEIRHRNEKQKNQYDRSLWLSWMFYFYVATLHFATRRLEQTITSESPDRQPKARK
jgi:hypothetical protein